MQNSLIRDRFSHYRSIFGDYLQLTKPLIVALLLFTTLTAFVVASPPTPQPISVILATLLGGAMAAGGSGALNQYFDRELDKQMARTKNRPIPTGRVSPTHALIFGSALIVIAFLLIGFGANWLAAGLAIIGAFYYVVIYTLMLKRSTPLNIIIGGGAGAMPVLVGWAAATGRIDPAAFVLFLIVFFWTPPHSWALAALVNRDYQNGRVPMLPAVFGMEATALEMIWYSLILAILTFLPFPLHISNYLYFFGAFLLGAVFLYYSLQFYSKRSKAAARQLYKYSSVYLLLLFLLMMLDHWLIH